jgi:hypothetical protein
MFPHVSRDGCSLSLNEAAAVIESLSGRRPPSATMHRWVHKGVGGVKLATCKIGGRYYTGRQAIEEFLVATQNVSPVRRTAPPEPILTSGLHGKIHDLRLDLEPSRSSAGHQAAKQFLRERMGVFNLILSC